MRNYSFEGVVIKRSNLGESHKLVTLYTRSHGKITLIAKGLRKSTSKRAGTLELFNLVKGSAVRGRGEIDTLTEVQLVESFSSWRKQLGRITLAYQLAEVVDKLTPDHQPHPEVFELLNNFLLKIGSLKTDWKLQIENWKLRILQELGFWSKDQNFQGNIDEYIEGLINRPLHSPKILSRLR